MSTPRFTAEEIDLYIITGQVRDEPPMFGGNLNTIVRGSLESPSQIRVYIRELLRKTTSPHHRALAMERAPIVWTASIQGGYFWRQEYFRVRNGEELSDVAKIQLILWRKNL